MRGVDKGGLDKGFYGIHFDYLSNIFKSIIQFNQYTIAQYSDLFTLNGIETPLFIDNWATIIFSAGGYIFVFLLSLLFSIISCWDKMKNWSSNISKSFLFNNVLRFIVEGYLEITFGSFLNVYSLRTSNLEETISFAISCVIVILFCINYLS